MSMVHFAIDPNKYIAYKTTIYQQVREILLLKKVNYMTPTATTCFKPGSLG